MAALTAMQPELVQAWSGEVIELQPHVEMGLEGLAMALDAAGHVGPFQGRGWLLAPFCWCEGSIHPDGCPPNFIRGDFAARWTTRPGRPGSQNRAVDARQWWRFIARALREVVG